MGLGKRRTKRSMVMLERLTLCFEVVFVVDEEEYST
jgi:hypothetical protein